MLRLTLFGGVSISRGGVPVAGAATRRRALALLALLAASRPRGITRDALCALLWPDAESEGARHSLNQLLFTTRRALGVEGLVVGTTTLQLDPTDVECDVWEFERALQDRQLERAVALHAGPFCDGFAPEDVPEVGARLDLHRAAYARAYGEALEQLARAAGDRGDFVGAARWWRLLVTADPLGARAARECIAALAKSGERAQALQVARVHAELVRRELGAEPEGEVLAWLERLRDAPIVAPAAAALPATPTGTHGASRADRLRARVERAVGGRYHVEALVEEESVAASFAARAREGRGEPVEIVVMQPRLAAQAAGDRFAEVMGRVARLVDPHLLPVFDAGASDDLLYFIGARRPPLSLRERLRRDGALSIEEAIAVARGVAAALGCAHASGLRHGDLRPRHVYLSPGSAVAPAVLRGVGVAEAVRGDERTSADRSTLASVGAPAYMSPEQLAGDAGPDARGDVYALGSILYEMLAGAPPFGRHSGAFARKLTEAAPPIRAQRDRVGERLAEVVERCLARVAADRFANGGDVVRALATV